jgi:hypothetical protein
MARSILLKAARKRRDRIREENEIWMRMLRSFSILAAYWMDGWIDQIDRYAITLLTTVPGYRYIPFRVLDQRTHRYYRSAYPSIVRISVPVDITGQRTRRYYRSSILSGISSISDNITSDTIQCCGIEGWRIMIVTFNYFCFVFFWDWVYSQGDISSNQN